MQITIRSVATWSAFLLVYGITLAICLDQIRQRDAQITRQKEIVNEVSVKIAKLSKESAKLQAESRLNLERFEEAKSKIDSSVAAMESINKVSDLVAKMQSESPPEAPTISLQENAKRQIAERQAILESIQSNQPAVSAVVPTLASSSADAAPKPWVPPSQAAAAKIIKDKAIAEWKDNYSMVNYNIERETSSFQKLLQYNRNPSAIIKNQLAKAAQEWPNNYSMMVYSVERQLDAKQKLDGR